jgi:uncharacterized protein (TIGR02611 family)
MVRKGSPVRVRHWALRGSASPRHSPTGTLAPVARGPGEHQGCEPPPPGSPAGEARAGDVEARPSNGDESDEKSRAMRMAEQLGERRERHRERSKPHRAAITVAGFLLVLAGIVLSGPGVPGPGFLVILIGLALLALEFDWAERLLRRGLDYADRAGARASQMSTRRKVVIAIFAVAAVAAAVAAVFVFDIPVPVLND